MKVISRASELEINGQVMKVEDVLAVLRDLPSKEIVAFFNEQGMNMPRKVRMSALHKVLDKRVKKEEFQKQFTDEVRYRVRWIKTFSEHQLEGTLTLISNADIYNEYRETLWLMFIKLHEELKIDDAKLAELFEKARGYKMSQKESITEYQRGMDSLFYDERNEVDGLEYNTFREVLAKSSTLNELREIGAKYNIDVPRRIKKEELVDIIIDACSANGNFSKEDEDKVKRMSVQQLQRFAKQNGVKASIELKKEDIIEYIISRVETEVQKSYVNLAVLDIPTEDDEVEEEEPIIEEAPIEEEAPVQEAPQSNAQIDELKAMILNLQQQMLNRDKSDEEKEELAKQAEEAQAKADAAEEALKAQQEAHEQQLAEVQAQHEEEKAQAVDEALAQAEAEAQAQKEAEEAAQKEAEALAQAEAEAQAQKEAEEAAQREAEELAKAEEEDKQAEMDSLREENETLKEQMANMQESKELEEDEFVIPLFEYEEAKEETEETPAEEETVVEEPVVEEATEEVTEEEAEEEPTVEEPVEEEIVEEAPAEEEVEEGVITLEDTENEEFTMFDEPEKTEEDEDEIKMEEFEDIAMPDIDDVPSENYQTADQPTETNVEEAPVKEEPSFDSPSYDDSDEYGSFDTPLFDTPIFEAPVFEAPIYGEDKAARERRLGNETRVDKKKKAAEEKAIKEALSADSKVARRKKKSNPVVTILKWLLILIVIALILLIILGLLGILGVLDGTPLQGVYEAVCEVLKKIIGPDLYESITNTIKGWFGKN